MITRIVKMKFSENHVDDFRSLFVDVREKIRGFEGCNGVELLQAMHDPTIFFTYSHWDSEEALNNYRHSELFGATWKKTKAMFSERAEAWSVNKRED